MGAGFLQEEGLKKILFMSPHRVAVTISAAILPFVLAVLGAYTVVNYTTDGRLATYAIIHSQDMTDEQLIKVLGPHPRSVFHHAQLMMRAIDPVIALILGILVGLFEKRIPATMTVLTLVPYFLWTFSKTALAVSQPTGKAVLIWAKGLGIYAAYVLFAVAIARFLSRRMRKDGPPDRSVLV